MASFRGFWDIQEPITSEEINRAKKAIIDEYSHDVQMEVEPERTQREDDKKERRGNDEAVDDVFRRDLIITAVAMLAVMWKYS